MNPTEKLKPKNTPSAVLTLLRPVASACKAGDARPSKCAATTRLLSPQKPRLKLAWGDGFRGNMASRHVGGVLCRVSKTRLRTFRDAQHSGLLHGRCACEHQAALRGFRLSGSLRNARNTAVYGNPDITLQQSSQQQRPLSVL